MAIFRGTGGQGDSTTDTTVTTVTQKAAEAASSATSAANSATSASNSATSAETSATNAATSETNAATSESNASTSATSAETAKTAAEAAQTAAETAETNAETAETNAVTAKNQAESARDNAQTAQTAAETAETNAETAYADTLAIFGDATDVQNAVNSASASATTATTKAAEAATSATNAANSATSAGTSETNAASSASQAATSANTAGSHATDAETAKDAAETAQAAAEAAEANINGLYLGSLADDPTLDGNGLAVGTGDLYFNTTENEVRVYTDNDEWIAVIEAGGDATFNSLTSNNDVVVKGNLEVQGTTITVDSATAQTIDLGDNDKIRLGDGDDLQIYHDGNHSRIDDTGTGNLILRASSDLYLGNLSGEVYIRATENGAVQLRYDNSEKFATTSSGVDITGNITVSGTVDGRDIATDGATLDAVASTYVDVSGDTLTGDLAFGDNVKAKFGASNDLQIYHDGSNSYVQEIGTGELLLRTNGARVTIGTTSGEYMGRFEADSFVKLYYDNAEKLATTSSGVDVTGTLVSDGLIVDGGGTFQNDSGSVLLKLEGSTYPEIRMLEGDTTDVNSRITNNGGQLTFQTLAEGGATTNRFQINHTSGDVKFYEDTGTTAKLTWDASAEELQFKDNVKAEFGDGGDLIIYHNGTNTFFSNSQGHVYLTNNSNDKDIKILTDDGSGGTTDYIVADGSTGEVQLYHYGSEKLATKSTGIDVTGTVTADGLTVENDADTTINFGNAVDANDGTTINVRKGAFTSSKIQFLRTNDQYNDFEIKVADDEDVLLTYGQGNVSNELFFRRSSDLTSVLRLKNSGDISFYDDAGTSQDFYWDASTSRLGLGTTTPGGVIHATSSGVSNFVFQGSDVGEGTLFQIRNGTNNSATGNGHRLEFVHGNNNDRNVFFRTSSSGTFGRSPVLYIGSQNDTGGTEFDHIEVQAGGDVAFYNDDSTSKDFYWDASTSRLGIGTTSPLSDIHIAQSSPVIRMQDTDNDSYGMILYNTASGGLLLRSDHNEQTGTSGSNIIFQTDGSEAARIDSSGRLGIGTTSPSASLHIVNAGLSDQLRLSNTTSDATIKYGAVVGSHYDNSEEPIAGMLLTSSSSNTGGAVSIGGGISACNAVNTIKFFTATNNTTLTGSEAMRIDSSGNVGIGTTSPSSYGGHSGMLSLYGSNATALELRSASGYGSIRTISGNGLQFTYGDAFAMRIDSSGKVGIGTTSPDDALQVVGGNIIIGEPDENVTRSLTIHGSNASNKTAKLSMEDYIFRIDGGSPNQALELGSSSGSVYGSQTYTINSNFNPSFFKWVVDSSEAMRLTEDGRLGIGISNPSAQLHLSKAGGTLVKLGTSQNTCEIEARESGAANILVFSSNNSVDHMAITDGGNVGIGTTSPGDKLDISAGNINLSNGYSLAWGGSTGRPYITGNKTSQFVAVGTNGTERMRIDSSGNLGIGTTSPTTPLSIERNVTTAFDATGNTGQMRGFATINLLNTTDTDDDPVGILFESRIGTGASGGIYYVSGGGTNNGRFAITARQQGSQNSAEILTIKNTGNVGIGTTSPATKLQINDSTTAGVGTSSGSYDEHLRIYGNNGNVGHISQYTVRDSTGTSWTSSGSRLQMRIDSTYMGWMQFNGSGNNQGISFGTGSSTSSPLSVSEKMRIDSSGNLLVGRTSTLNSGALSVTGDSSQAITAQVTNNANSTFQGFDSSGNATFIATGDGRVLHSARLAPSSDGSVDIGSGSARYQSLYLSGGVYLGGTGSANLLDDYEEGTWTPTFSPSTGSFTTMTMDALNATYTKIGDTVAITAYIRTDDVDTTGGSGQLRITGLPFASSGYHAIAVSYSSGWSTHPKGVYTESGQTYAIVTYETSSTGVLGAAPPSVLATGTTNNANRIILSGVYKTSA